MRALANFAMQGRFRALLIAVASSGSLLFVWVGASVVALVTLRKGYKEGLSLLLWASLPAFVLARVTGDSTTLALLLGTGALAVALRATVSLALTALLGSAVAVLTGIGLLAFGEPLLAELARVFGEFFAALESQAVEGGSRPLGLLPPTQLQLAGMMGTANGALSFLCLILGRYWQSALYNPGGFATEFRALRFPPYVVWGLALTALAVGSFGLAYRSWGACLLLPLTAAGFALLHARASVKGQSSFWLGGVYAAWLVFDAAKLALVGLVLADSLMDFRRRWNPPAVSDDHAASGDPESDDRESEKSDDDSSLK